MEVFKSISLLEFQEWYKENEQFYDPSNVETLSEMLEDYKKYKESEQETSV